ncbi:3-oxoacyl-ACP synthase III [Bacteriovoracaceae bacterium]|nr:3-oxoacyl-ACP synthase III [Bacteriovoracaceae bacterium]
MKGKQFKNVYVRGMQSRLPESILTSNDLEDRLKDHYDRFNFHSGRIELMTGVKSRHIGVCGEPPSILGTAVSSELLKRIEVNCDEIDMIIYAGVCRDGMEPSTASIIASQLKLGRHCQHFDISDACLGVIHAWWLAGQLIENGVVENVLVVSSENSGPLVENSIRWLNENTELTRKESKQYLANLTIGSGAFASVLSNGQYRGVLQVLGGHYLADTVANNLCQGSGNLNEMMMRTDSEKLMKAGVSLARDNWGLLKDLLNWSNESADHIVTHQVGKAHHDLLLSALELPHDRSFVTYPTLGNTGSVALPIALNKLVQEGNLVNEDLIALLGIGSGLGSLMMGVKWVS